jgi:cell volume regulation protein A
MSDGPVILAMGALLAAGLLVSVAGGRVRVPGLVLVLGLGMAIGSDGTDWIDFSDYELARRIGIAALALILFEGGLSAGFAEVGPVLGPALRLAIVGTAATAAVVGAVAHLLFDFSWLRSFLLGGIVASTDAAAIFAVLRGSTLRRRVARTLEAESGLNDPIAILIVFACIDALTKHGYGAGDAVWLAVRELALGLAAGLLVGAGAAFALRRLRLPSAGLYPVASLASAAMAYGAADSVHGSGFLAVYLAGLVLGSVSTPARRTMATFHDGIAWIAQLTLFLVLGLLVFPSHLGSVAAKGAALAAVLTLVARPLAVLVSTIRAGFDMPERLLLGWAGLRGAVPVVLATLPVTAGVGGSREFFDIVFFAVVLSTLVQGTTVEPVARALGVTSDELALPAPLVEPILLRRLGAEIVQFPVRESDAAAGRRVRELGLPREALLNLLVRGERAIPPRGSTVIEPGDQLHVIVRQEAALEFRALLERWRDGPLEPPPRPRPRLRASPPITTVRPWSAADGDPTRPQKLGPLPVIEQLRTRRDEPGALVRLEDGRYAATGTTVAIGPAAALQAVARRRLARATKEGDRAWWQEVIGALAR